VNVDTLTLTATPIPRTLQFSLMGARDLSIINTPPPNRYPVTTEVHVFNENTIRDAINYEFSRGGQVFFIHNRVQDIHDMAAMIQKLCPEVRIAVGHGQMDGDQLEEVMMNFIAELLMYWFQLLSLNPGWIFQMPTRSLSTRRRISD